MKNNLKKIRMDRFITQQELASRVQVSRQTIGSIERGEHNPTLNLCIKVALTLEVTLDDLFWMDEYEHKDMSIGKNKS